MFNRKNRSRKMKKIFQWEEYLNWKTKIAKIEKNTINKPNHPMNLCSVKRFVSIDFS